MTTLPLCEWTTTDPLPLTELERSALKSVLGVRVRASMKANGRYEVMPRNTIGTLVVGSTTFVVEPKITIPKVLFLLGYCSDPKAWKDGEGLLAETPDLVSGVTALFTVAVERALRRGLLAGYRQVEGDLPTVRGRIDLAEQLRRRPGVDIPLAVTYVEHDEDILENRLLLAAAHRLGRLPLRDPTSRRRLHSIIDTLANVTPCTYTADAIPEVSWTRLNEHYRPAVELAQLLLQDQAPEVGPGRVRTPSLAINMATLFETFVRTALREALGATAQQLPKPDSTDLYLDDQRRVRLKPDLTYWPDGRHCAFIGDVKYKIDTGSGHREDVYQLMAYATVAQLPEATLIYAEQPLDGPRTYHMDSARLDLHVRHVDLSKSPAELIDQVGRIAAGIHFLA